MSYRQSHRRGIENTREPSVSEQLENPLGAILNDAEQFLLHDRIHQFDDCHRWKTAFQKYANSSPNAAMEMIFNLYMRVIRLEEQLKRIQR